MHTTCEVKSREAEEGVERNAMKGRSQCFLLPCGCSSIALSLQIAKRANLPPGPNQTQFRVVKRKPAERKQRLLSSPSWLPTPIQSISPRSGSSTCLCSVDPNTLSAQIETAQSTPVDPVDRNAAGVRPSIAFTQGLRTGTVERI